MTDVLIAAPLATVPIVNREALEMQAFEKGRIQGELEATRRMEAEAHLQQKQMIVTGPTQQELEIINLQRPDVVEINRLTWLQRGSWLLGEAAACAMVILTIVWIEKYRGALGWSNNKDDARGYDNMFNTFMLSSALGLFFVAQAISHYRILPINLSPMLNRAWYIALQACAVTCWSVALAALVRTQPDATFWSAAEWCYALGFALTVSHAAYSMIHALVDPCRRSNTRAREYADSNNGRMILESPEQARDHSTHNQFGRSVYTPAPHFNHTPATLGASAPAAPANAPRWAENPNTYAEDYFLVARAKWAVVGFWAIGAAMLMEFASVEHAMAAGQSTWSQGAQGNTLGETSRQATIIGCLALVTLATLAWISYTAMPPRTTLVKNGILTDQTRRTSISHNAETQLHNNQHIV